jgi:tol-pal system protein YbgF
MDALRARLDKVSDQVAKLASQSQSLPPSGGGLGGFSPSPTGDPGSGSPAGASGPGASMPTPDVLYNTALRDYTAGNYPLSAQEFSDYLRYYPNTTLASNAQFYIGDIFYQQGQFERAIEEYDKAIEQYPNGNKSAAAQLKKGYAYLNLNQRTSGVRELNNLMKRFPNTPESALAKDRIASLGPEKPAPRPARKPIAR